MKRLLLSTRRRISRLSISVFLEELCLPPQVDLTNRTVPIANHQFLRSTLNTLQVLAAALSVTFKSRAALQLENLALGTGLVFSSAR